MGRTGDASSMTRALVQYRAAGTEGIRMARAASTLRWSGELRADKRTPLSCSATAA